MGLYKSMQEYKLSPLEIGRSVWSNRELLKILTMRDVMGRYRGSVLGLVWSFLNPILMLAVYTFVFGEVFKARWISVEESHVDFALVLFAGLVVFNLFAESVNRAPSLILANANYVKKIVFPLDILSWVVMASAIVHALISLVVWLIVYGIIYGLPPVTSLLLPALIAPLVVFTMGISWFLAALGVYFRDVTQVVSLLVTMVMFLSPIFYPVSSLPVEYRTIFQINPITPAVEMTRDALIWGKIPELWDYLQYCLVGLTVFMCGFAWFQKTRKGFADVI